MYISEGNSHVPSEISNSYFLKEAVTYIRVICI